MPGAAQRFGVIVGRTCLARRLFRPAIGPPPGKQCARTGQRSVAGTQAHRSSLVRIQPIREAPDTQRPRMHRGEPDECLRSDDACSTTQPTSAPLLHRGAAGLGRFFIGVPLAWAVVLIFHPAPDPDHIHGSLEDEVTQWLVVHCLTLIFIGLMCAALYLLVRDLPGTAAKISRIAVGPFVLFYGAGLGIAVGVLVQYANAESPAERGAAVDAAQLLWDNFLTGDVLLFLGAVAWGVAALAAAVAHHRVGAPLAVSLLLGLSTIVLMHGPPIGPIGLVCFATAIVLLARSQRKAESQTAVAPRAVRSSGPSEL
jgi:hypothetical protein